MLDTPAGSGQTAPPRERRPPGHSGPGDPVPNGRALLASLRRRLLPFLACALLIPILAALALHRITPLYTATGTLIYEPNAYKPRELQSILRTDRITEAVMASQAQVLGGLRLIEPMAQQLHLFSDPEFNPALRRPGRIGRALAWLADRFCAPAPPAPEGPGLNSSRDAVLLAVQQALVVRDVDASRVLSVSFTAQNPVIAAAAANGLMDIYIKSQLAAKYGAVRKARRWLESRAAALRREVRAADDRIAAYRAREGLVRGVRAGLDTEQISHLIQKSRRGARRPGCRAGTARRGARRGFRRRRRRGGAERGGAAPGTRCRQCATAIPAYPPWAAPSGSDRATPPAGPA